MQTRILGKLYFFPGGKAIMAAFIYIQINSNFCNLNLSVKKSVSDKFINLDAPKVTFVHIFFRAAI